MPTVPELRQQCRDLELTIGGTKAVLEQRIAAHLGTTTDPTATIPGFATNRPRAESVASTVSASSAGGKKDKGPTFLTEGNALKAILAKPRASVHQAAFDCLETLDVLPNPEPGTFTTPAVVTDNMRPIQALAALLVSSVGNIEPSGQHGENMRDLIGLVKQDWKINGTTFPTVKPQVEAVLKPFLGELTPTVSAVVTPITLYPVGFVDGTQQAVDNALLRAREKVEDLQPGMTDPTFPSDEDIDLAISANGISYWRVVQKKLGWKNASTSLLQNLLNYIITNQLANFDMAFGRLLRVPSKDDQQEWDKKLIEIMPEDGSPVTTETIEEAMEIHDVDSAYRNNFFVDVSVRNIIIPVDDEENNWILNLSILPDAQAASIAQPVEDAALEAAISRVKLGIERYLRAWTLTFPEPDVFEWPGDFSEEQRKQIRAVIKKFIDDDERNLAPTTGKTKSADIDTAIKDIMALTDFPVAKGHTQKVVTVVLKASIGNTVIAKKNLEKRKAAAAALTADDADTDTVNPAAADPTVADSAAAGSAAADNTTARGATTAGASSATGGNKGGKRKRIRDEVEEEEEAEAAQAAAAEAGEDGDAMDIDEEPAAPPARKLRNRK